MKRNITPFLVTAFIVVAEVAISFNSALLPSIKDTYHISNQLAQMTISLGLFALGFAGLIYGGLADSLGRRPMLIVSTTLFCAMSLLCALAPTIEIFMLARFLQGMGAGAGWVVGNSCLNDIYSGREYTKIMNYVHAVAGITPAVAPVLGSYLGHIIGWRNCFILLFFLSVALVLKMIFFQPETLKQKKAITVKKFFTDYSTIFHNGKFITHLFVKIIAVVMIFCETANLPLLFVNYYGVAPEYYGLYVSPLFLFYVAGNLLSDKLNKSFHIDSIILLGLACLFCSNFVLLILLASGFNLSVIAIQIIKTFSYLGWGFIFGNATAVIVSSVPGKSGMTSAVMIALEMLFSALGIVALGLFFDGTMLPLTVFITNFSLVAALALVIKMKRDGNLQ